MGGREKGLSLFEGGKKSIRNGLWKNVKNKEILFYGTHMKNCNLHIFYFMHSLCSF